MIVFSRKKVGDIFSHITTSKLRIQYAKAREADGHYEEAAQAYVTAGDHESAVRYIMFMSLFSVGSITTLCFRIYLDCIKKPGDAVQIVKQFHSKDGAKLVAR